MLITALGASLHLQRRRALQPVRHPQSAWTCDLHSELQPQLASQIGRSVQSEWNPMAPPASHSKPSTHQYPPSPPPLLSTPRRLPVAPELFPRNSLWCRYNLKTCKPGDAGLLYAVRHPQTSCMRICRAYVLLATTQLHSGHDAPGKRTAPMPLLIPRSISPKNTRWRSSCTFAT